MAPEISAPLPYLMKNGCPSAAQGGRGVNLTTHSGTVQRLTTTGALPPLRLMPSGR